MDYKIPALFLIASVIVSGCIDLETPPERSDINQATIRCVSECEKALEQGRDLSSGPCLSNKVIENWVCDVAHAPRLDVDNDPANQCPAYGNTARHFIELDPDCNFIRAV